MNAFSNKYGKNTVIIPKRWVIVALFILLPFKISAAVILPFDAPDGSEKREPAEQAAASAQPAHPPHPQIHDEHFPADSPAGDHQADNVRPILPEEAETGRAVAVSGRPADDEAKDEDEPKPETLVDVVHAEISRGILTTASWMDSFFGDRRYESELNESYVRFSYNVFLEKDSQTIVKPDFNLRLVLPQLRERTHLILTREPKEGTEFSAMQKTYESEQASLQEKKLSAAVEQMIHETAKHSFSIRAGLQLRSGRPAIMIGPRYRILFPLDHWKFRFVEEVVWRSYTGWEARTTGDLERSLPYGLFFRATNEWIWIEDVKGFLYAVRFNIGQPLSNKRGLEYEWVNIFHTEPVHELTEVVLRIRYRQKIWRDWLFFELNPQCRFPKDRDFNATPGILFRLDLIFGNYL